MLAGFYLYGIVTLRGWTHRELQERLHLPTGLSTKNFSWKSKTTNRYTFKLVPIILLFPARALGSAAVVTHVCGLPFAVILDQTSWPMGKTQTNPPSLRKVDREPGDRTRLCVSRCQGWEEERRADERSTPERSEVSGSSSLLPSNHSQTPQKLSSIMSQILPFSRKAALC